jgi:hypothetical protein
MWQELKGFFGFSKEQPTPDAAQMPDAAALAALQAQAAMQGNVGGAANAANDENYSLTGDVNAVLARMLRMQAVQQHVPGGSMRPALFPLKDISLTGEGDYGRHGDYAQAISSDGGEQERPHGERVTLEATLAKPMTDYDAPSLKRALTHVVGAIPAFAGKVVAKPIEPKHATYAEVETELLGILNQNPNAFKPEEIAILKKFFEATPNKKDEAPWSRWYSAVDVRHRDSKLYIRVGSAVEPIALGGDKKVAPVESSDQAMVDYFKAHRKPLLEKIKAKVAALCKADGTPLVTEAELTNLDLHATANWGTELLLGTKPENSIDPATNQKLVGEARAKMFTETPLVRVDTDKLAEIFTQSLVEVSNPLPPMLEKFVDGHMLAQILRQRLPNNPSLEAFFARHDMFLTRDEKKAKEPKATNPDQIVLDEPRVDNGFMAANDPSKTSPRISLSFDLPVGMTMHQLYDHIATNKNQLGLGVQQQAAANAPAGGIAA